MRSITLLDALALSPSPRVAITGSGGKTSLLFRLARALGGDVWLSNSARLAVEQGRYADRVITLASADDLPRSAIGIPPGVTLFTGLADEHGRTTGLPEKLLAALAELAGERPLLIEADGSRMKPLKAWAPWEPPIPGFVTHVVVCAGLSGLGGLMQEEWVYRPKDYARLLGVDVRIPITAEHITGVLTHPRGGLKNIPEGAARMAVLNQADMLADPFIADGLARSLLTAYSRVLVTSLRGPDPSGPTPQVHAVHQPVAGILLAAGGSNRFGGKPKQLLEWQGEPLVRRQARIALEAGLSPVMVVTGAYTAEVEAALAGLPIRIVNNAEWEQGQGGSVRTGVTALPETVGAVVFLLVDQPYVTAELIQALVKEYAHSQFEIVAPWVGGQRANPALFDRRTFAGLAQLQGDAGGRQLMGKYPPRWVEWPDERLLWDIDRPEDYRRAMEGHP